MAGIEAHAGVANRPAGDADLVQFGKHRRAFGIAAVGVEGMRVGPGVDFADAHADAGGGFHLRQFGVDEGAGDDAGVGEPRHHLAQARLLAGDVEPALGGDFVPALGHQHGHLGLDLAGDADHLFGGRHFEVELDVGQLAQAAHVAVLDVAAIFAQMHGDAVGPAEVRFDGRPDRIGFVDLARLAHRRYVVDVDAEFYHAASARIADWITVPAIP